MSAEPRGLNSADRANCAARRARSAEAVLDERADTYLGPGTDRHPGECDDRDSTGGVGTNICYRDEEGRANLRSTHDDSGSCHPEPLVVDGRRVRQPAVYWAVLGDGPDIRALQRSWTRDGAPWRYPDVPDQEFGEC